MCLLQDYRQKGYARKCLEKAVEDIAAVMTELQSQVAAVVVPAPPESQLQQKLALGGFAASGSEYMLKGVRTELMCLPATQTITQQQQQQPQSLAR
jgi:tRNA G26 N,N-dimethylase Trm1